VGTLRRFNHNREAVFDRKASQAVEVGSRRPAPIDGSDARDSVRRQTS